MNPVDHNQWAPGYYGSHVPHPDPSWQPAPFPAPQPVYQHAGPAQSAPSYQYPHMAGQDSTRQRLLDRFNHNRRPGADYSRPVFERVHHPFAMRYSGAAPPPTAMPSGRSTI